MKKNTTVQIRTWNPLTEEETIIGEEVINGLYNIPPDIETELPLLTETCRDKVIYILYKAIALSTNRFDNDTARLQAEDVEADILTELGETLFARELERAQKEDSERERLYLSGDMGRIAMAEWKEESKIGPKMVKEIELIMQVITEKFAPSGLAH